MFIFASFIEIIQTALLHGFLKPGAGAAAQW
jgi:hypothetical protein